MGVEHKNVVDNSNHSHFISKKRIFPYIQRYASSLTSLASLEMSMRKGVWEITTHN